MEQKKKWCQDIKQLILESFKGRIPDSVKNLIMGLGREHDDGETYSVREIFRNGFI